jgi:hypothetical protein
MASEDNEGGFDERLVALFRNRAQLKKSYQDLQTDFFRLQEQLKNANASTRRAEERLEAIERLMAKPEAGYNGLVYFQLRALWRSCNDQLVQFAEELARQQEEKERKKLAQKFNADRSHRLGDVNDLLHRIKDEASEIAEEILTLEEKRKGLSGIWNYFRRRSLDARAAEKKAEQDAARTRVDELLDKRLEIEGETPPDFDAISVEGRRIINIAVVAYAHHLHQYFSQFDIARLAREAVTRPIQDLKYGSEEECTRLISQIQELMLGLKDRHLQLVGLKELAQEIRRHAEFRSEEETVPVASSLDEMVLGPNAGPGPRVNVLSDEFWDIYEVFRR